MQDIAAAGAELKRHDAGPASHRDGPLAVITLDAPPLNLFDQALIDGLRTAIDAVAGEHPRGLLFQAEGRVVSAGVDARLSARIALRRRRRRPSTITDASKGDVDAARSTLQRAVAEARLRRAPARGSC